MKALALVAVPADVVTTIFPLFAPTGTVAVILDPVASLNVAAAPPIFTLFTAVKLVPTIAIFAPAFDQHGSRVESPPVKRRALLTTFILLTLAASPATRPSSSLGERVVKFCNDSLGQQVGNGECATLAFKALTDVNYQLVRKSFGENHVVVELLVTGTFGDGSKARFHACDILTLRDGLIAAKRSYRKVVE